MGTTLTGTQIQNTYDGLIKTTDNTAISATTKLISDGLGNDTCIKVGTAGTDFLGNVDFSAATVTGLPGGAAGLVNGTGADSLKNADSLVTTPADSNFACDIALGNGALTNVGATVPQSYGAIAIGNNTTACIDSITIGGNSTNTTSYGSLLFGFNNSNSFANGSIAIGANNTVSAFRALAIGNTITGSGQCSISIGFSINNTTTNSVAIGCNACARSNGSVSIGINSKSGGQLGVSIGQNASSCWNGVAIGCNTTAGSTITGDGPVALGNCTTATGNGSIAIGWRSTASGACTYVIGENISSSRVCTLVTHQVESTVAGKGIVVTSPDGLTTLGIGIDNTGAIVTYTP